MPRPVSVAGQQLSLGPHEMDSRGRVSGYGSCDVSLVVAVDATPGLRQSAGIKRLNDILVDGAKVGDVLALTQSARGERQAAQCLGPGPGRDQTRHRLTPFTLRVRRAQYGLPRAFLQKLLYGLTLATVYWSSPTY